MKQAIITGTSRGLGKALAEELLQEGWNVVGISRTHSIEHSNYTSVIADLSKAGIAVTVDLHVDDSAEEFLLINNAATLGEIGYLGEVSNEGLESGLILNVIASSVILNRFISQTEGRKRTVLSISSGASQEAYDGWSMYCGSKAAMDMVIESCILEREIRNDFQTRLYSIAPGVIDTKMQEEIRSSKPKQFSKQERFIELKENKILSSADEVAKTIISLFVNQQSFKNGWYDVRKLA